MNLTWRQAPFGVLELLNENRNMVAWIVQRPIYCDRGHWQAHVEIGGLDHQDGFPRYYMHLETAKRETEDFLKWRLEKIRAEEYDHGQV